MKKNCLKIVKVVLCMILCFQLVDFPTSTRIKANDITYDHVYSGQQSQPITLYTGTYLFDNVTVEGTTTSPSAITIAEGNNVTITVNSTLRVKGADATGSELSQSRAGAGIRIPESSKLVIRGTGTITATGGKAGRGGNGVNGDVVDISDPPGTTNWGGRGGFGGNGAGAGIGGEGETSSGMPAEGMGRLEVWDTLKINAEGGTGGDGGNGGKGGSSVIITAIFVNYGGAGGGGGGGGGGGMPAAKVGGGGIKGASGGRGGNADNNQLEQPFTPVVFAGGAGGGGGAGWSGGGGGGNGQFSLASSVYPSPIFNIKQTAGGSGGNNGDMGGEGGRQMTDGGGFSVATDTPARGGERYKGGDAGTSVVVDVWPWGEFYVVTTYRDFGKNLKGVGGKLKYPVYLSEMASMSSYTTGGGVPGYVQGQILPIYDLSHPSTKINVNPKQVYYTADKSKPNIEVYSAKGVYIPPEAYTVSGLDNSILVGKYDFTVYGKETEYEPMRVVNSTQGKFEIVKAPRKISISLDKANVNIDQRAIASLVGYEAGGDVSWEVIEGQDLCEVKSNGASLEIFAKSVGTVKVRAKIGETDNYLGAETQTVSLTIYPAGADLFSFGEIGSYVYTAKPIEPKFKVYFGKKELVEGKDYRIEYSDNIDVGEGCATVIGMNDYDGEIPVWFVITPADIKYASFQNVRYDAQRNGVLPNITFTGKNITSDVGNGIFNDSLLENGKDYTVTYSNTYSAGEVTVTITGQGNFAGSKTEFTYRILPADIGKVEGLVVKDLLSLEYDGSHLEPDPQLTLNGMALFNNTDYTLTYENNRNVGTGYAVVHGKGNFTETSILRVPFEITRRDAIVVPDAKQLKSSGEQDPKFTYKLSNIIEGDDVTLKKSGVLEREIGELVGNYKFYLGTLTLDTSNPVNNNYNLKLSDDVVNFEIKEFWVSEDATIIGTKGKNDWYIDQVNVVPPAGYKIGYAPNLEKDSWEDKLILGDGDFTRGLAYFLREYDEKTGKLGRISQSKTLYIKQDSAAPSGRIIANDVKLWQKFTDISRFTSFFKEEVNVDIISEDATSGIAKLSYFMSDKEKTKEQLVNLPESDWTTIEDDEELFTVDNEKKFIVYARFEDMAGNELYINSEGMILDMTAPTVAIDYDNPTTWIADKNATAKVHVFESLSEIRDRYVDVRYQSMLGTSNPSLIDLDEDGDAIIKNLPDGDSVMIVTAQDNAGNIGKDQVTIKIDTQDPLMYVDCDVETYAQFKDIEMLPKVGPSGVEKMLVQRQEYGDKVDADGTWIDISDDFNLTGKYHVEENGSYYFKYVNRAKVNSNIAEIHIDRIDRVTPQIQLEAIKKTSNTPYVENSWANEVVRIKFKNIADNIGTTKFQYRLNNGAWVTYEKGNDYQVQFDILDTGAYTIDLKVVSASGLSEDRTYHVNIDKVKPSTDFKIEAITTYARIMLQNAQMAIMSGTDKHSGMKEIAYMLVKADDTKTFLKLDNDMKLDYVQKNGGWTTITGNNANALLASKEKYVVYFKAVDQAGNIAYYTSDELMIDGVGPEIVFDESAFIEYGAMGKWITQNDANIPMNVMDDFSGVDYVTYTINTKTTKLVAGVDEMVIQNLPDGDYQVSVEAYDKAGNKTIENLRIKKDSSAPTVKIIADTENYATSQEAKFELDVDPAGLEIIEMKFVQDGVENTVWDDITANYKDGYTVVAPGTLYVRVKDKLGRVSEEVNLKFDNIKYIKAVAKIDAIDEEGNILDTTKWLPKSKIRIYNETVNVSDFTYEYKTNLDTDWKEAIAKNGYVYLDAPEGETTFTTRVKNNIDVPEKWSEEATLKVRVDAYSPKFSVTTNHNDAISWNDVNELKNVWGIKSAGYILLKDIMDPGTAPSGIASGDYAIFSSDVNKQLLDFPKTMDEIKNIKSWKRIDSKTLQDIVEKGSSLKLFDMEQNKEYVAIVRMKDKAGNVHYVSSDIISIDAKAPIIQSDAKKDEWYTNDDAHISITVSDNLSGANDNTYKISYFDQNGVKKETLYNYIMADRSTNFKIPLNKFVDGISTLTIYGSDKAGNVATPLTLSVKKDTVMPEITATSDDDETNAVMDVQFTTVVGISGIQKVEVIHDGKTQDITSTYSSGYKITRNGSYTFYVTNNAGVRSQASEVIYDRPFLPPSVILKAYTSDNQEYVKETWTNKNVKITIMDEQQFTGVSTYLYSMDQGDTWSTITPTNNEYWLLLDKSGKYDLLFKIVSPAGVESDGFPYRVNIQKESPVISVHKSTEELTKDPVTISVSVEGHYTDVQYSFDGGISFHEEASIRIPYNDSLNVIVKDTAGNETSQEVSVTNIDMQRPVINNVQKVNEMSKKQSSVKTEDSSVVHLDAFDPPKTGEQGYSGIKSLFWTSRDPYTNSIVSPEKDDVKFIFDDVENKYKSETAISFNSKTNKFDNSWIVAIDNVGNITITSLRLEITKNPDKPVNPDNPIDPDNPQEPIERIKYIKEDDMIVTKWIAKNGEKQINEIVQYVDGPLKKGNIENSTFFNEILHVLKNEELPFSMSDIKNEMELISKLLKGSLSDGNDTFLKNRFGQLQTRYYTWWILIIILIILDIYLLIRFLKKKKCDKETTEQVA